MATNLDEFERALVRFTERELPAAVAEASRGLALAVLEGVVRRTPVDTGQARANWQVGLGRAPGGTLGATDPSGGTTIARGARLIARAQPFEAIWIVNNLPYVVELEHGSSTQAPSGITAATLASLRLR